MRDETSLISDDLTQNNELAFSSTRNLQFYRFQILKFFFLDFGFGRIGMNDICDVKTGSVGQTQLDSASESEKKMSQSQAMFFCVCFTCSSKGYANWL